MFGYGEMTFDPDMMVRLVCYLWLWWFVNDGVVSAINVDLDAVAIGAPLSDNVVFIVVIVVVLVVVLVFVVAAAVVVVSGGGGSD